MVAALSVLATGAGSTSAVAAPEGGLTAAVCHANRTGGSFEGRTSAGAQVTGTVTCG